MRKCVYFVEGECEKKLIDAMKSYPSLIRPGKVHIFNTIQNSLSYSILVPINEGDLVFVFDSDVPSTGHLKENISLVKKVCRGKTIRLLFLVQVRNFEDELVRATDARKVTEITGSRSMKDFKSDFIALKDCRSVLRRHSFDVNRIWRIKPPAPFSFPEQCASLLAQLKK